MSKDYLVDRVECTHLLIEGLELTTKTQLLEKNETEMVKEIKRQLKRDNAKALNQL